MMSRKTAPTDAPKDMVWIAGGTFLMGSNDFYSEERPAHRVTVDGFWMDRHPVSNADFRRFVKATGYVTVAERPPEPGDYPGADPTLLVPGSLLQEAATGGATVTPAGDELTGNVIVLAVPYPAAVPIVQEHGHQLDGKIIVDITNPVNFETWEPVVAPGTSGAEEIAGAAPEGASVVKAFNTTFAGTLVEGEVDGQPLDVLIAGDDPEAKATVARLVEAGGLRAIDAGPLKRARQLEAVGLLHMALQSTLDTGFGSAVKIIS